MEAAAAGGSSASSEAGGGEGGIVALLVPWVLVGWFLALCVFDVHPRRPRHERTAEQLRREVHVGLPRGKKQKRTMRRPQPPGNNFAAGTQKERQSEPIFMGQQLVCQNFAFHTLFQRIFTFRKVGIPLFLISVTLGPHK